MSQVVTRFKLLLYNFGLVSSLKEENTVFKVSNFVAFSNVLKIPLVIVITMLVFTYPPISNEIVLDTLIELKGYSVFSKFSIHILVASTYITSIVFSLLQVKQRHEMCSFVNNLNGIFLNEKYSQRFRKDNKIYSHSLLFVFMSISIVQYLGAVKISILSFFVSFFFIFPNVFLFSVVSFVTGFESFVIASLEGLQEDFEEFSHQLFVQKDFGIETFLQLSRKYQNIYNLTEQFNDFFGAQLTLVTCHFTIILTFGVR